MWHGFGLLRAYQGRVEEAFTYFGRAREIESTQLLYTGSYGTLLYHTRHFQQAIDHARALGFDQAGMWAAPLVEQAEDRALPEAQGRLARNRL